MSVIWFVIIIVVLALFQMQFFYYWGLRKIEYKRFFSRKSAYEGEKTEMVEILSNNKAIPLPWLRIESRISPYLKFKSILNYDISYDQFHKSIFFLRGHKKITRRHEITCTHRGYFKLGSAALSVGDLFGLLNKFSDYHTDETLYVYPALLSDEELPDSLIKWQGDIVMRRWIMPDPILVSGIREYRSGDPQKDIHWRATASTGRLQVKVRDFTVSPKILILLNTQVKEDMHDDIMTREECEVIESGVRVSAHLAAWAILNGLEAGFYSNGRLADETGIVACPPFCSSAYLELLLQTMAKLVIVREMNFHVLLDNLYSDAVTGMDIVAVSPYWSETLENRAEKLRSSGNNVSHILFSGGIPGTSFGKETGSHEEETAV
ncbi:MAG: DUF58 domain-containing protein [Oscillospiraceae bacterium]|jgi:uncharacterized protein (DUF58 family)|nr:DUF58 domain-containing protein [Oscillospiraceae bacterium]